MTKVKYVFHHIPKCGGSSLNDGLKSWFNLKRDYRGGHSDEFPTPHNLEDISSDELLCGHFDLKGNHLTERYPGILDNRNFRVFSFIRDPLHTRLSLNRFEKKVGASTQLSILEDLALPHRKNWISKRFPLSENNYKDILDKYFFIGVLEESQQCVDLLAKALNRSTFTMPWLNSTDQNSTSLTPYEIEKFKDDNALDYMIYDYILQRLQDEHSLLSA